MSASTATATITGYSLALGSAEVTLLEQANAFRTLANLGTWAPIRMQAGDPSEKPRALIAPSAAWIVGDILSDASARATTFGVDSALRLPFWAAAKTGTSKAMRDNWCIGYTDRFTVAVWVGNLEGDSMRAVSGTTGAAPVWRDVMMALHQDAPGKPCPARPASKRRASPSPATASRHAPNGSSPARDRRLWPRRRPMPAARASPIRCPAASMRSIPTFPRNSSRWASCSPARAHPTG